MRNKLNALSPELDDAYGDAIKRIESQLPGESQTAKEVLAWIVCATRPLTTRELENALAIDVGEFSLDEENILGSMTSLLSALDW